MNQRGVYLTTIVILFFILVGCSPKQTNNGVTVKVAETGSRGSLSINTGDVEWITNTGGLPGNKWKVLFPSNDYEKIEKIVEMINSTEKMESTDEDTSFLKGRHGYPVLLTLKMKNNNSVTLQRIIKITRNGSSTTMTPLQDRVLLEVEKDGQTMYFTIVSETIAKYIVDGSKNDLPLVREFIVYPDTIKPGETVTISGDGSTQKEILVYITDGDSSSDEKYLIAKIATNKGAWKWSGTVNGRTIKTLDGKEVKLTKDRYFFETTVPGGGSIGGGMIDLSGSK